MGGNPKGGWPKPQGKLLTLYSSPATTLAGPRFQGTASDLTQQNEQAAARATRLPGPAVLESVPVQNAGSPVGGSFTPGTWHRGEPGDSPGEWVSGSPLLITTFSG